MKPLAIKELYYITHKDNISSILKNGIISHALIQEKNIKYTPIYDVSIVSGRKEKTTPAGKSLWEYANLYFQPRNPMLYRVTVEKSINDIAVLGISPSILSQSDIFIADGNAACHNTIIMPRSEGIKHLPRMFKNDLRLDYWSETNGSKRRIMAECLVPSFIEPISIKSIFVANFELSVAIKRSISKSSISVIHDPRMFFLPNVKASVSPNITICEGDMFFSKYHTLTISVNTVGIMGKGVASRAKYQFPDVYVGYQDLCRSKQLAMGKPFLIQREKSLDEELADDPKSLTPSNDEKWFLLFATKDDWRHNSNIEGIKKGLIWIQSNYSKLGIKSLAMPALGCGLGNLDWKDVGPLMCKYLAKISIPVQIYLPLEKKIEPEFLTEEYLLKTSLERAVTA